MSALAITGGTVLSLGETCNLVGPADVLVRDGVIAAVGRLEAGAVADCDSIIDATGQLVVPGFVNAHLHSPASLSPGTVDDASHPAFMWLNQADTANRTPREIYVSALVACTQMLLSGTTSVIDHFPEQNFSCADVEAVVQAYEDSGMRATVALLSCAHCIWVDEDGLRRMAQSGAVAVHNPESNLKFGSGFAPLRDMKRLGVTVALGTDGVSQNDNLILHDALHLAAILHRSGERDRSRWIRAEDALRMATLGGARAMRLQGRIGAVEVGMRADLVLYSLDAPWWRPLNDPVQQMVHAENGSSVRSVLIDGRMVVRDGRIASYDAAAIAAEADGMLAAIRQRNAGLLETVRRIEHIL